MAQQLRGRGQRQSRGGTTRGDATKRIHSARNVFRIETNRNNQYDRISTTKSGQAALQEPYPEILLPASNAPALPSQQMMSNAQTVEITYKFFQPPPSPLQIQPRHINYQRCSSDQAYLSNQMSSDLPRQNCLLDTYNPEKPRHINYQRCSTDQTYLSNQMSSDLPRSKSLLGTYPEKHGPNIDSVTRQDNMPNKVCRPKTRKTKNRSLSRFDGKENCIRSENYNETVREDPDEIAIFTYLVKNMKGIATPNEIVDKSMLFTNGDDVTAWFKRHSRIFTIFENSSKIIKIAVYVKDATYCRNYNSRRSCDDFDCLRYHICRNLLYRNCRLGDRCRLSHNCLDQKNFTVSDELGFTERFSNDDIINILSVRYPCICESWNQNASCSDKCCINLHMCPNYILGRCEEGPNCRFERSKASDHNSMVIKAYRMENMTDQLFKKQVYVTRHLEIAEEAASALQDESELDINRTFLCEKNLTKQCRDRSCTDLHVDSWLHRLPYIWQVKIDNKWIILDEDQSVKIEEDYCAVKDVSDIQKLTVEEDDYQYFVVFSPGIKAFLRQDGNDGSGSETKARRLSTKSYSAGKFVEKSFKTQWRWYWENDSGRPQLFTPDNLQHTLENKYVNKQVKYMYLYQRDNDTFRYSLDFNAMTQLNLSTREDRKIYRRPAVVVTADDIRDSWFPVSLPRPPNVTVKPPANWMEWDLAQPFELVELDPKTDEYQKPMAHFLDTLSGYDYDIDNIYRVQNYALWSAFIHHKSIMRNDAEKAGKGSEVEERKLFHGTNSFETVRGICINNFDHRLCGENGTKHGKGAYFATTARYSNHYTNPPERYLFLARVLVGDYAKSDPSYTRPPSKPGSAHDLYDSCVDSVEDPSIFVVFDTKQYYPEFLIQYHRTKDPPISVVEKRKPIPPQKAILTAWNSFKLTDSSDFVGTVDRKIMSKPPKAQNIPLSTNDKDSEKISRRQAREVAGSSVSTNFATSNNYSEGCSRSSRIADLISLYDQRTADRDCTGSTNTTLSKSEMRSSATVSVDQKYAGRHRIKIYGLEEDSSLQDKHEKLADYSPVTKNKPAAKSESNFPYLAKSGYRSDETHTAEQQLRLYDTAASGSGGGNPVQESKVATRSRHREKNSGSSFVRHISPERYSNDF